MNHRNMRREIAAVVFFLKRLVTTKEKVDSHKIELFVERLAVALQEKFKGHWYPENPSKGQAYRCIRVNGIHRQDPELLRACWESGIQYSDLGLPCELTLWVDPGEVCCRYGEQCPCFSVATFSNNYEKDKDVAKKVTSVLERVTADYHSGSSSNEESSLPPTIPSSCCANQELNPSAPAWHPKTMVPGKGYVLPQLHYNFRPHSVAPHTLKHNLQDPPGYKDVAKKVTSALERVTSDYHSGSFFNDERSLLITSPLAIPSSCCANQELNPSAPAWHPKKMVPRKAHVLPQPHYSSRLGSVAPHTPKHNLWVPPGYRGGNGYWDTNPNLVHCNS